MGSAFSNPASFRVCLWALIPWIVCFLTLPPSECAFQPSLPFKSYLFSKAHMSSCLLNNVPLSPIMSSLQEFFFHMGRSPITIRPFWKFFSSFIWAGCPLQWNHFEKSSYFSSLWKTCAGRPLQQDHFEKSLYFSPFWKNLRKIFAFFTWVGAHYNKTISKNFFNFLWVGHPWQFDHFKISEFAKEKSSSFYSECTF